MASVLLRNVARVRLGGRLRDIRITARTSDERYIMTSRARLEKVLEELQKNPYYDKYAGKIAKLQQTSPDEFLQRVEQQEKAREKKGIWTFELLQLHWQCCFFDRLEILYFLFFSFDNYTIDLRGNVFFYLDICNTIFTTDKCRW